MDEQKRIEKGEYSSTNSRLGIGLEALRKDRVATGWLLNVRQNTPGDQLGSEVSLDQRLHRRVKL
jgi:hypothetical protein